MVQKKKISAEKPTADPGAAGTLYIVATPIGNLEDITLRALRILKDADLIAAEDTRHTRKLLTHFNITTPTISYYKEKEQERATAIVTKLHQGQNVALVTDAGTPGISDPGAILVQKAVAENIRVVPVPGPSSLTAALSVAGMPDNSFIFLGFAPSRSKHRRELLLTLRQEQRALVFFEAPHRLQKFLQDCYDILGDRLVFWCRELTKIHEEQTRSTLSRILDTCKAKRIKGESILVISGTADVRKVADADIEKILGALKQSGETTLKDAVQYTAVKYGLSRSTVYKKALKIWKQDD